MPQDKKVILKEIYPLVEESMKKNLKSWEKMISNFMSTRANDLYDIGPFNRIYFNQNDVEEFFQSIKIEKSVVSSAIQKTFYYGQKNFINDVIMKDELTITAFCILRYFFLKNDQKHLELSMIYLSFSGRFYPYIHANSFPTVVPDKYRHVMEYVINNLSNKYDIVREGNLIGAIKSICNTWLNSYRQKLKTFDDEDVMYTLQQLHSRIKSFIKNIAVEYYDAYANRDYLTYDSDSLSDDDFHLADSDSLRMERIVAATIEKLQTSRTDYSICKMVADANVRTDEISAIIDSINSNPDTFAQIQELIKIIVGLYFRDSKTKDVTDIAFLTYSISPKPNSKDELYLREKEIIEDLLQNNASRYRTRSKRIATKNSYNRSLLFYYTILINKANS